MTAAENSVQESRGLVSKLTTTVGDAFGTLKSKAPTTEQVKSGISDHGARVSDVYDQWRGRDYAKLGQMFRDWASVLEKNKSLAKEVPEETKAFLAWLKELSEPDLKDLIRQLYTFGASMNLDLKWLIDPEKAMIVEQQLKKSIEDILHLYCLAYWKSKQIQGNVKVLIRLQKWLDEPNDKENAKFNKQMFTKLVAENHLPPPPIELFLATEEERQVYSVEAIKEFIKNDTQRFYELLKTSAPEFVTEASEDSELSEAESVATS